MKLYNLTINEALDNHIQVIDAHIEWSLTFKDSPLRPVSDISKSLEKIGINDYTMTGNTILGVLWLNKPKLKRIKSNLKVIAKISGAKLKWGISKKSKFVVNLRHGVSN